MPDDVPVRRAAEATVGDERDLAPQPRTHDGAGPRQHLAHARPAARAVVADDDAVALRDVPGDDRIERVLLAIEDARAEGPRAHRVTGDLHDPALGRERAAQHDQSTALRDRPV